MELKIFERRKPYNDLKISDPILPCKNPEKISVGYDICENFP